MAKKQLFNKRQLVLTKRQFVFCVVGILLLTAVLYFNSLNNNFTNWDDDKYITESVLIKDFSFQKAFTTFSVGLYTPITTLSYALDSFLFGLEAWGVHFTSLCLHLCATFLVVLFVRQFSGKPFVALVVGLLFAVHPTHVEAVAWASSRKDLLYSVFGLLSMICYIAYSRERKWSSYIVCWLCFVLACLSKPTALGLPLVFCGLEYILNGTFSWKTIKLQIPFLMFSLLIFAVGIYGIRTLNIKVVPETGYTVWQVICMASYGFVFYFYKALFPLRLSNFHIYPFPGKDIPGEYLLAPFLLAFIIYLFIKYKEYIPGWKAGIVLFLVLLLPTYRLYPAGYPIVAERYFYLSSIGLFFIVASFVEKYLYTENNIINIATVWISGLIVIILCFATYSRTLVWKNSYTLWSNTIKIYPTLYYAYSERGKYLLATGNKQGAVADFDRSLTLQPNNTELLNTTSNLLFEIGDTAQAKRYLDESLKKDSSNHVFYYNKANILKAEGKYKEAVIDYNKSIRINPTLAEAYNNRGVCRIFLGDTLGARTDFTVAHKLNPTNQMFYDNLTRAESLLK